MNRVFDPASPELMDRPQPVSAVLEADLLALESLNRRFGSHRLVRHFLEKCAPAPGSTDPWRVLDLCTGGGDLPRLIVGWARARGIAVRVTAVDFQSATLELARRWSAEFPEIEFFQGDARTFTPAQPADFTLCSLALHHFTEADAVAILSRMREVTRGWMLCADLERHPLSTFGIWLLTALFYRAPMTRHDARASAAAAFSFPELADLARTAGWADFSHERFFACRQAVFGCTRRA